MKTRLSILAIILTATFGSNGMAAENHLAVMNTARLHFAKGELNQAFSLYDKIPKSSDYWLEAQEEKSQVLGRKKDYAGALSLLQTSMSPAFVGLTGPEPYFVAALTHLKTCDYSAIFRVSKLFKERFSGRVAALAELEKTGNSNEVQELLKKMDSKPMSFELVGPLAKSLPRNLHRDQIVFSLSKQKNTPERKLAMQNRLKQMAKAELKEIEDVVNKLQVAEAEVIQRIYLADTDKMKREGQGDIKGGKNTLRFPYTGEVWLDELDNYAARIEKCPATTKQAAL